MFLNLIKDATKSLEEFGDEKFIKESEHADLATTIAFKIAKEKNLSPQKVANEILERITPKGYIGKIESVNGYINLFANYEFLEDTIDVILSDDNYGSLGMKGKILVEHTSANPDGPLHIGHIRNSIIGDTLARIFRRAGFDVRTHYYINDMGRQMAITVLGVEKFGLSEKKPDHAIADAYISANRLLEKEPELEKRIEELMQKYEVLEEETAKKFRSAIEKAMEGIKATMERINVEHDEFVWESDYIRNGYVEKILKALDSKNLIKKTGAWIIELEGFEKEVVIRRENGTSLYITRDLAYHLWKSEKFERMINVWGADHKLYGAQLLKLLEILEIKKPEIVFFEFVSLPEGRMSTRKGKFISADDLIEKVKEEAKKIIANREFSAEEIEKVAEAVAIGAIRFDFLKVAPEKPMVFDMNKALDFERQTASYIQYTYSRACSILRKSDDELEFSPELCEKVERDLVVMLSKLPFYVYRVVNEVRPNLFAEFMLGLASKFNEFYRDYPVLKAEDELKRHRIAIVSAVSKVLEIGLDLMGIQAIERM
ncbi:MAG: arginine--tRNA ligase [Archaeoglobaceae archaeon]|nr:arginine--tRNA ligase [Archaeoglobaceae archaeon]MDW8117701.1 arginine--tRNA ligase [Archaeoglobaceae archaeon]